MYFKYFLILIIFSIQNVYSGTNNLSFNNFPDTIFIKDETSVICKYEKTNTEIIINWAWRILFFACDSSYTLLDENGFSGDMQNQWTFNISNLPSISNGCHDYFIINEEYYDSFRGYIIVFAKDSNNETHSLIKEILIVGEKSASEPCGCMQDFIFIESENETVEENETVNYKSIYIDDDGSGSITEYWNWRFFSYHETGKYLINSVDSLEGLNSSIWRFKIDSLDKDFNFVKDSTGNIISFISANTIDSDLWYYGMTKKVSIMQTVTSLKTPEQTNSIGFDLVQNFPNPFNPSTRIVFSLQKPENVYLIIYNSLGQKIKTLLNGELFVGKQIIQWNGKDNFGNSVTSGQYLYTLKVGNNIKTKKMLLID